MKPTLSSELGEIWRVNTSLPIVVDIYLHAPSFLDSISAPPVKLYQTSDGISFHKPVELDFGLKWYLEKRVEEFLRKNWPPASEKLFLNIFDFIGHRINNCTAHCVLCDAKLEFAMLKPSICDKQLCAFGYDQLGIGIDISSELHVNPQVMDLLISFTYAACQGHDVARFTPFPKHVEVTWKKDQVPQTDKFVANPSAEPTTTDMKKVADVLRMLPSVAKMSTYENDFLLKEGLDQINRLLYPLLRWILTSNRAHIAKLLPEEQIPQTGTNLQFVLLSTPPKKEKLFQATKKARSSFYTFHGSGFHNWHSILRNGLRNLSGTSLMSTGAAYGNGIYMAQDSGTSLGYAAAANGWPNSMFGEHGLQCVAICEVINAGYKANPYYVVPDENHVVTRYLLLFNSANPHQNLLATSIHPPKTRFSSLTGHK
eukprot:TRINITY_DN5905_c0_g1_i2.p1 TRINITY_DN5905_c0_g1~~TRINITY_DN5905_c0_g1_i2.p1  ORF type:complete len:489 (-),score=96.86 TRINITY_DN5905_c0_g1_i2:167-1447(-)